MDKIQNDEDISLVNGFETFSFELRYHFFNDMDINVKNKQLFTDIKY
jgi:hypothetical protein